MRWTADRDTAILARQAEIARVLRVAQPDTSDRDASNRLTEKLTALIAELGLPRRFRDIGIDRDQHLAGETAGYILDAEAVGHVVVVRGICFP